MTISVNGESRTVREGLSLGALIDELGIRRDTIAIARNAAVVPRGNVDVTPLVDGDAIEIIVAVAGG